MRHAILLCATLLLATLPAKADAIADFYRGKTIGLYIGFPPGGGYDLYARILAQHMPRHIPGNPTIVVHNMAGGVGVRAASFLTNVAAQDGTALGLFQDGLTLSKVLGGAGEFDPIKFAWIGRIVSTATFTMVWHTSPAQSVEEVKHKEITIAATVRNSSSSYVPLALNDLIGTKFNIIRGYQGAAPMALAMERGEVNAHGGMALEAIKPEWLAEKKAKLLFYLGGHRHKTQPDVHGLLDLAIDEKSRRILGLFGGIVDVGRSFAAAPGTPPDRVAALRTAFMAMVSDPVFVTDMGKRNLGIEPLPGAEVQKIIAAAVATPAELAQQAGRYLGP